jgi:hypothetical protein
MKLDMATIEVKYLAQAMGEPYNHLPLSQIICGRNRSGNLVTLQGKMD